MDLDPELVALATQGIDMITSIDEHETRYLVIVGGFVHVGHINGCRKVFERRIWNTDPNARSMHYIASADQLGIMNEYATAADGLRAKRSKR